MTEYVIPVIVVGVAILAVVYGVAGVQEFKANQAAHRKRKLQEQQVHLEKVSQLLSETIDLCDQSRQTITALMDFIEEHTVLEL